MKRLLAAIAALCIVIPFTTAVLHAASPGERYDLDRNGVISRDEVLAAIREYFAGELVREDVIEIVALYFSGESVESPGPTPSPTPSPSPSPTPSPTPAPPTDAADLILVEPEVWDCYLDRDVTDASDAVYGCGGWGPEEIVYKWDNDNPVVIWATGAEIYLDLLEEAIVELSPILGLDFRMTDRKEGTNILACMGITKERLGEDCGPPATERELEAAGYALGRLSDGVQGEITSGYLVVWLDEQDSRAFAKHVVIHELLHAVSRMHHPPASRPDSIMGRPGSDLPRLSPMDIKLLRLNSHPAIRPGMTMEEVRALIDLRENSEEPEPLDMVWQAGISLVSADTTRFHLSGGWIGNCDQPFATASQPHILELHDFPRFLLTGARGARYQTQYRDYWMAYNKTDAGRERRYWTGGESSPLEQMPLQRLHAELLWYEWPNKFPRTLHSFISEWGEETVNITVGDDSIRMRTLVYESYEEFPRREDVQRLEFVLTLDAETYDILSYEWRLKWRPRPGYCTTYEEIAHRVEIGVDLELPSEVAEFLYPE